MTVGRIHQFSPQRTAPEDLEAILVAREPLLNATMAKIRNSATTKNKHHRLFVGQRGIGKTHLLSLINHRVSQNEKLNSKLRVAWLNEDETSSRFLQLLIRIYRSLSLRYPEQYPPEDVQGVIGTDPENALKQLSDLLVQRTGKHTILLLIENLDAHFAKFSVEEQRRWRGFMQDHPVFTTVATAQRLFDGIAKQDEPFFGFFDSQHLAPLTVDQTTEMLKKLAAINEDKKLEQLLSTDKGRSRLQVVHFLAGGNPRLYVLMAELITEESLDDVVQAFEAMVDRQLTSYYQERLRWLAPLQQDIVQVLCRHRPAISVKDIAEELFTTNQSISGQLKELRSYGYVRANKDGREMRYELAEPLMRLVMQVKETNSQQPLRLLVEFLQAWFERQDLESRFANHDSDGPGRIYLEAAIESFDSFREGWPVFEATESDNLTIAGQTKVIESADSTPDQMATALVNRGNSYHKQGDAVGAIADYTAVIEMKDAPVDRVAIALMMRAVHHVAKDVASTIADYTTIIGMKEMPIAMVAGALVLRSWVYVDNRQPSKAIADCTTVIKMEHAPVSIVGMALNQRIVANSQQGNTNLAATDLAEVMSYSIANLRHAVDFDRSEFLSTAITVLYALPDSDRSVLAVKTLQRVSGLAVEEFFGRALVGQLAELKDGNSTAEELISWNRLWQELGAGTESLDVPLRLLSAGIDYLVTKKETALLELPLEERQIVRQALELDDPA